MCVVLDPDNVVWAVNKIYEVNSTPTAPSLHVVLNGNPPSVDLSTLFVQCDGELPDMEVHVQGVTKVVNTRGNGFVTFRKSQSPGEGLSGGPRDPNLGPIENRHSWH